jgi:pyridoxamine 5'-phosphate oxidase
MTLASRRKEYETAGLDVADVVADPMAQWELWFQQATDAGCVEPNAFALGTVDAEGYPQSRYLLAPRPSGWRQVRPERGTAGRSGPPCDQ